MDANTRGCLAEYLFAVECMKRGYEVSVPLLHTSIYDLIIDTGQGLFKIQIKSTIKSPEGGRNSVHVPIQNNKPKYTEDRVDYFAVYSSFYSGFFIFKNTGDMQAVRVSLSGKHSDKFNKFVFE